MTTACSTPWFAGLTCDHLYADCPNRIRSERTLRLAGWWDAGDGRMPLDPHDTTDICGMCLHRHNRKEHA